MTAFYRHPLQTMFCRFNRHAPDRDSVHWDGTHYAAICSLCSRTIRRHAHRVWKEFPEGRA